MPHAIDSPKCMICYMCKDYCPQYAIDYVGSHLEVNPEKCDDCGLCVENCYSAAITKVGEVKTIVPHEQYEIKADVVVLGGGISGLISAVRCAQLSEKKIVVLEKTAHVGGNAWFGHGPMPVGTQWEIEAGGVDIREDYIKWVKTAFKGKFRDGLIHNAVYACGEFFDWLVSLDEKDARECFKVEPNVKIWFQDIPPRWSVGFPERKYYHLNCKDAAMGPGFAGSYTIRKMMQKAPEYGVEVLYNKRAVELRLGKDGKFCGVIAEDEGGRTFVTAKACVVATGNCMYNDELIKLQWPLFFGNKDDEPVHRYGIAGNTGDIIMLVKSIGVTVDPANLRVNMFGPVHHPFNYVFFAYCLQPDIIYVNMNGDRFFNESRFANGSTVMHLQPKRKAYAIIDNDTFEAIGKRMSPDDAEDSTGMSTFSEPTTKNLMKHYREEMESEVGYDFPMFRADTLKELAEKCGIDPGRFVATIEKYNGYCDAGFDPDFGKDPAALRPIHEAPFYAILGKMATDQISIGTHISDNCEMLDNTGKVIPGIFVTGDNAADWQFGMEDGPGEHRGHIVSDMTWATASGYLAGKNVADYLASC